MQRRQVGREAHRRAASPLQKEDSLPPLKVMQASTSEEVTAAAIVMGTFEGRTEARTDRT